jgi:hypothetical protein
MFLCLLHQMSLQSASPEMLELLKELKKKVVIGFIGGSDLVKITEQLTVMGNNGECEIPVPHRVTPLWNLGPSHRRFRFRVRREWPDSI